jgi:ABC-type transport system substrate-binding protein
MVQYEAVDKHYRQTPAFKTLISMLIPEESTRVAMLETGELDAIAVSIEGAASLEAAGFRTKGMVESQCYLQFYGAYDPRAAGMPTADVRVRTALSLAINRDEIGKNFFLGRYKPPLPFGASTSVAAYIDLPYWTDVAAKAYRYDPEEAKRLLTEAGYPNGFSIKLYPNLEDGGAAYTPKLAEVVQGYWQKIGVKAQIIPVDWGAYQPMRTSVTSPPTLTGAPARRPTLDLLGQVDVMGSDPQVIGRALTGCFYTTGSYNLLTGDVPGVDDLQNQILTEINPQKLKEIVAKAIQVTMDTRVCNSIVRIQNMMALGNNVDVDLPGLSACIPLYAANFKHRQ